MTLHLSCHQKSWPRREAFVGARAQMAASLPSTLTTPEDTRIPDNTKTSGSSQTFDFTCGLVTFIRIKVREFLDFDILKLLQRKHFVALSLATLPSGEFEP